MESANSAVTHNCSNCIDGSDTYGGKIYCYRWFDGHKPQDSCPMWEAKQMRDFGPGKEWRKELRK